MEKKFHLEKIFRQSFFIDMFNFVNTFQSRAYLFLGFDYFWREGSVCCSLGQGRCIFWRKDNETSNSLNAVEREPVSTRVLTPNASEASYKPKQRSYRKMTQQIFFDIF